MWFLFWGNLWETILEHRISECSRWYGGWNFALKLAECSYRQRDMRLIILWQQKSRKQPDTADIGWNKCLPEWTMF